MEEHKAKLRAVVCALIFGAALAPLVATCGPGKSDGAKTPSPAAIKCAGLANYDKLQVGMSYEMVMTILWHKPDSSEGRDDELTIECEYPDGSAVSVTLAFESGKLVGKSQRGLR